VFVGTNQTGTIPGYQPAVSTNTTGTVPGYTQSATTNTTGTVPGYTHVSTQKTIMAIVRRQNAIELTVHGPPFGSYSLQSSVDLRSWTETLRAHFGPTGQSEIVVQFETAPGKHFFRLGN